MGALGAFGWDWVGSHPNAPTITHSPNLTQCEFAPKSKWVHLGAFGWDWVKSHPNAPKCASMCLLCYGTAARCSGMNDSTATPLITMIFQGDLILGPGVNHHYQNWHLDDSQLQAVDNYKLITTVGTGVVETHQFLSWHFFVEIIFWKQILTGKRVDGRYKLLSGHWECSQGTRQLFLANWICRGIL